MRKKSNTSKGKLSLNKKAIAAFESNAIGAKLIKGGGNGDVTVIVSSLKICTTHSNTNFTSWTDPWNG